MKICVVSDSHDRSAPLARAVRGGTSWLVNPGTIAGIGAPATYVLADLTRMEFSVVTLEADEI